MHHFVNKFAFLRRIDSFLRWVCSLVVVFTPFVAITGYRAVLGLCGYVVSNVAFLFAAVYFYR